MTYTAQNFHCEAKDEEGNTIVCTKRDADSKPETKAKPDVDQQKPQYPLLAEWRRSEVSDSYTDIPMSALHAAIQHSPFAAAGPLTISHRAKQSSAADRLAELPHHPSQTCDELVRTCTMRAHRSWRRAHSVPPKIDCATN